MRVSFGILDEVHVIVTLSPTCQISPRFGFVKVILDDVTALESDEVTKIGDLLLPGTGITLCGVFFMGSELAAEDGDVGWPVLNIG